jgi:mono/diheme cytochrome c family protein
MKTPPLLCAIVLSVMVTVALSLLQRPQAARALPTFAQAYQVDCSVCHTMVPALNAYGRYVQSTAFAALDPKILNRVAPLVVRESVNYQSTGNLDPKHPTQTYSEANLSVNLVGLLNSSVSYRVEQSLYQNNVGGGDTGHLWVAYNRLLHGDGHLIVGKFDAPAPPAFSFWQDASAFASPEITVGQHGYLLDGVRWGVGFNYVPQNYTKRPYKIQVAYLGNSPSLYNSSVFSNSNPYAPNQSGSDRAFQYKAAYARPDRPVEAGIYGAAGSYVLANGYVAPADHYDVIGVYAQRDPVKSVPGVLVFYQQTHDSNVGPGAASGGLQQRATSRAFALEFDESILHGDVMVGIRPVEYLSGLQASTNGLDATRTAQPHFGTFNVIARDPNFSPYLYAVFQSGIGAASNAAVGQPTWSAQLKWAGPLFRAPALAKAPSAVSSAQAATAIPSSKDSAAEASPSPQLVKAGETVYVANCASCHNANGTGGVGPTLHNVAVTKSYAQTIAFIEKPSGIMPKLYPGTLSEEQVKEVAAYVRATFH